MTDTQAPAPSELGLIAQMWQDFLNASVRGNVPPSHFENYRETFYSALSAGLNTLADAPAGSKGEVLRLMVAELDAWRAAMKTGDDVGEVH